LSEHWQEYVGAFVGGFVGALVGAVVEGPFVGNEVGEPVGALVVGFIVGKEVGVPVGVPVVGSFVGNDVGKPVGAPVVGLGATVGAIVGKPSHLVVFGRIETHHRRVVQIITEAHLFRIKQKGKTNGKEHTRAQCHMATLLVQESTHHAALVRIYASAFTRMTKDQIVCCRRKENGVGN